MEVSPQHFGTQRLTLKITSSKEPQCSSISMLSNCDPIYPVLRDLAKRDRFGEGLGGSRFVMRYRLGVSVDRQSERLE